MSYEEIFNYIQINESIGTAGQPSKEQLHSLAGAGYSVVINLATTDKRYSLEDEEGVVTALGMTYHHLPVDWEAPTKADFAEFERLMLGLPAGKTLIHCAANYRVTAFYGLYAMKHLDWSRQELNDLRARIWGDSDFPAWEQLVSELLAEIDAN